MCPTIDPPSCPACGEPMTRQDFAKVAVDHCLTGCRGIWFDRGELQKLDHQLKGMSPALRDALSGTPPVEPRGPIDCPHCREQMDQLEYEAQTTVTVDRCRSCEGIFLDAGELGAIRNRPLTGTELKRARIRSRHRAGRHRRREQERHTELAARMAVLSTMVHGL
jgi:uncharacterized protein